MFGTSEAFSGFAVKDAAAAHAFYADVLGLDVTPLNEMGFALHIPGSRDVFVYPKDDHVPAVFTILNFPVDDVHAAVDALIAKGVTMQRYDGFEQDEKGVADGSQYGGPVIAWFTDPSGNVLAVMSEV